MNLSYSFSRIIWLFAIFFLSEAAALNSGSQRYRFRRSIGSPSLGYGGGLSFTANLNPYNFRDPVDFAYGVSFGYGLDGVGQKLSNALVWTGSGGNGVGKGNGWGGVTNGYGYGGGNTNAIVYGSPGYQQSFTNNIAFSGNQGNGYGQGNAVGQVIPYRRWYGNY